MRRRQHADDPLQRPQDPQHTACSGPTAHRPPHSTHALLRTQPVEQHDTLGLQLSAEQLIRPHRERYTVCVQGAPGQRAQRPSELSQCLISLCLCLPCPLPPPLSLLLCLALSRMRLSLFRVSHSFSLHTCWTSAPPDLPMRAASTSIAAFPFTCTPCARACVSDEDEDEDECLEACMLSSGHAVFLHAVHALCLSVSVRAYFFTSWALCVCAYMLPSTCTRGTSSTSCLAHRHVCSAVLSHRTPPLSLHDTAWSRAHGAAPCYMRVHADMRCHVRREEGYLGLRVEGDVGHLLGRVEQRVPAHRARQSQPGASQRGRREGET